MLNFQDLLNALPGMTNAQVAAPSDATVVPTTRALYIAVAGAVVVDMAGGQLAVNLGTVPIGTVLPLRVTKVRAATAATVVLLW